MIVKDMMNPEKIKFPKGQGKQCLHFVEPTRNQNPAKDERRRLFRCQCCGLWFPFMGK